ncbi:MAG: hypothetical protein M1133_06730 [Armatimonadetes bacterium]|nr:hypothetical protein [Armatimonadota bacterium]
MELERAKSMLDDFKYSIGRLVVYRHIEPKLPRQSYGHYGHERTVGEVVAVDMDPTPEPHWVYTLRNVRNNEIIRLDEDQIKFATTVGRYWKKSAQKTVERKMDDGALAEMIAKALSSPERASLLRSTLRDIIRREEIEAKVSREGADLPVYVGDYIRVRGDLRKETDSLNNHYAKILSVEPSDIAGIENALSKPGQSRLYRTLKKYHIITSEGVEGDIYDAEIKLFYTANARKTVLNWRAATLLAEAFGDQPPYKLEYEYLADHIFTREELQPKSRGELAQMLASMLYVKGRMGWRDYQRRNQFFAGTPKSHLVDDLIEVSRFDSRRNRVLTHDEITHRRQDAFKLRRLLKGG